MGLYHCYHVKSVGSGWDGIAFYFLFIVFLLYYRLDRRIEQYFLVAAEFL